MARACSISPPATGARRWRAACWPRRAHPCCAASSAPDGADPPAVLYLVSDLSAGRTGIVLGASARGVREIRMIQTQGFSPRAPYTAQDVAAHARDIFSPEDFRELSTLALEERA